MLAANMLGVDELHPENNCVSAINFYLLGDDQSWWKTCKKPSCLDLWLVGQSYYKKETVSLLVICNGFTGFQASGIDPLQS